MCRKPAKKSKLNKVLEKCCGNTNLCTFRISDAYFVSKNLNLVFLSQVKSVIFPMCLAVLNNVGFDLWLAVGNTSHKLFEGIFFAKDDLVHPQ